MNLSEDCEFDAIREGEFLMLRGPSGGGKTTLLNILGTLDQPTSGKVEILNSKDLRLKQIGFVFQTFNLLSSLSAFENVELPMTLLGIKRKERTKRAIELLEQVGLKDRMSHLPSELSGGEQQRVYLETNKNNSKSSIKQTKNTTFG